MKAFRRILSVLSAAIWLGAGVAAQAATITVNSTWDGFVLTLPGQPPPPPACTLRDAITAANTNLAVNGCVKGDPGLDTIAEHSDKQSKLPRAVVEQAAVPLLWNSGHRLHYKLFQFACCRAALLQSNLRSFRQR